MKLDTYPRAMPTRWKVAERVRGVVRESERGRERERERERVIALSCTGLSGGQLLYLYLRLS